MIEKLKDKLKRLPFGSDEYIKTLGNILYLERRTEAKIYSAGALSLGLDRVYGTEVCKMYSNIIRAAEEMLYNSEEPSLYLFGAIGLIMEGESKVNEFIYANK